MGAWTIVVHGHGMHHNKSESDADEMAKQFVYELKKKGHSIYDARIMVGSNQTIDGEEE